MENEKQLIDRKEVYELACAGCTRHGDTAGECNSDEPCERLIFAFTVAEPVDAVEVVHGRWIFGTCNHREYMKCSVCLKSQTPTGVFTYCPNCGAKMDGGSSDNG